MLVFVPYTKTTPPLLDSIREKGHTPIILFSLSFISKQETRKQLETIKEHLKTYSKEKTAIELELITLENYVQGIISSLRKETTYLVGRGGLNKVNRFFLEQTQIDYLKDPHNTAYKKKIDFIHHFNSGLNQVLINFMRQKNTKHLVSIESLKEEVRAFGRVKQNIMLSNKKNIETAFCITISNEKELSKIPSHSQLQALLKS